MTTSSSQPELHTIRTPVLEIAYYDVGPASSSPPIILLHGFPYAPRQFNTVRDVLVNKHNQHVLIPFLRGYGPTKYLSKSTLRSGEQAVLAKDLLDFMDALSIPKAILAGYDWGGRAACIVAALHPERCAGLLTCQGYAIQDVARDASAAPSSVAAAEQMRRLWYQFYFNTPQGVIGLTQNRGEICRFLWETWSPDWKFEEEEWQETLKAFEENEDFVDTVIHSYRVRYANVAGEKEVEDWERRCAGKPPVTVPTVILRGKTDGVHPCEADGSDKGREMFTAFYERKNLDKVGHCPPAEAPQEFVEAIMKLVDVSGGRTKI